MNEVIVRALQADGPVRCMNWSRGKPLKGMRWKIARAWGACKSIIRLVASGPRQGEVLYYPANSKGGLYYDLIIIALARILQYRVVLHHHAYYYIDAYTRKMALLNRLIGKSGGHAVHCKKMRDDFLEQYPSEAQFLFVPPTVVSQQLLPAVATAAPSCCGQKSRNVYARFPEQLNFCQRVASDDCNF